MLMPGPQPPRPAEPTWTSGRTAPLRRSPGTSEVLPGVRITDSDANPPLGRVEDISEMNPLA